MDGKSNGSSWDPLRVRAVGQERTFTEIPISGRLPPALLTDVRQEQTFTGDYGHFDERPRKVVKSRNVLSLGGGFSAYRRIREFFRAYIPNAPAQPTMRLI